MSKKCWLVLVAFFQAFALCHCMDDLIVSVNTRRWLYFVPERFLSMTIDPLAVAFSSPLSQESLNMAKGLSPSFVRLGGLGTGSLVFGDSAYPTINSSITVNPEAWDSINRFVQRSGLDVIVSLNPGPRSDDDTWVLENTQNILKYSNEKSYDISWQFGYDVSDLNSTGSQIGRDIIILRSMLDKLNHYRYASVFPPDVSSLSDLRKIKTVKDMLQKSSEEIVSVILQPKFEDTPDDPELQISSLLDVMDNYVWNRDGSRGAKATKKPFWIAEPRSSDGSFKDAMTLTKRLGAAARLGCQIYLRKPGFKSLKSPTPEFWLALLYKNLVGQGVLETKVTSGTRTDVQMFSHCTPSLPENKTVLNTGSMYEKGAITVFGVNDSPKSIRVALKTGAKEEEIHVYLLTSGGIVNANDTEITLFNGQPLTLSPTWELPLLSPKISQPQAHLSSQPSLPTQPPVPPASTSQAVIIPAKSIFFLVMPESRIRTCSISPVGPPPEVSIAEWTKRLRVSTEEPKKAEAKIEPKGEVEEGEVQYVSFTRKKRPVKGPKLLRSLSLLETRYKTLAKPDRKKEEVKTEADEDIPLKYIMINENGWINKLSDKLKAEGLHRQDSVEHSEETVKSDAKDSLTSLASVVKQAMKSSRTKRSSNEAPAVKSEVDATKSEPLTESSGIQSEIAKVDELVPEDKSSEELSEEEKKSEGKGEDAEDVLSEEVKNEDEPKEDTVEEGIPTPPPASITEGSSSLAKVSPHPDNQKAIEHIMSLIVTKGDDLYKNKTVASPETVGKPIEADEGSPLVELPLKHKEVVLLPTSTLTSPANSFLLPLMAQKSPEMPADDEKASVKVMRQIGGKPTKLKIPIDPVTEAPKIVKVPSPSPSPEKLKQMRAKYAEDLKLRLSTLRARMLETREKLQMELKKTTIPREDTLKNKIRKREEELKDWFRKFDKRETLALAGEDPLACLDDQPSVNRINHKRSLSKTDEKPAEKTPVLFPLNVKTQGIVYNNKIYPAKLFGIIELPEDAGDDNNVKYMTGKNDYSDEDYDDISAAESQRKVQTPKDPYLKNIDPESPYVPVVILSPGKKNGESKKSDPESRVKRSTLSDRIAQLKETLFPKRFIDSLKKEFKPWTRDVRSSRIRRTIDHLNQAGPSWVTNEILPSIHTRTQPVNPDETVDIGSCDEIGTSKESLLKEGDVIRGGQGESEDSLGRLLIRTMVDRMKSIVSLMKALKEWSPFRNINESQENH